MYKLIRKYIKCQKSLMSLCVVSLFFLQACNGDTDETVGGKSNITLDLRSAPVEIINNALLYVFDANANFHRRQLNVRQSGDILSTDMEVGPTGIWNLVLLSCKSDISGKIILPEYNGAMHLSPMWRTGLKAGGEFLEQTPELRYAPLMPTVIAANTTTQKDALLNRNVAKIRIILKEYGGFDEVNGSHAYAYAELLDVPTTLLWNGKLSLASSEISDKPLREYFVFDAEGKAAAIEFIIPADIEAQTFDPLTANKIRLKVSMPMNGLPFYGQSPVSIPSTDIPFIPVPNGIIEINLTFKGEPDTNLDVKVTAKEWEPYIDQTDIFN